MPNLASRAASAPSPRLLLTQLLPSRARPAQSRSTPEHLPPQDLLRLTKEETFPVVPTLQVL